MAYEGKLERLKHMTSCTRLAPRTLLVTENMVEAEDLIEILTLKGMGPVLHVRYLNEAKDALNRSHRHFEIIIVGLSQHVPGTEAFIQTIDRSSVPLLWIDGNADLDAKQGSAAVLRPFSTREISNALTQLGVAR